MRFLRRLGIARETISLVRWQFQLLEQAYIENASLRRGWFEAQQTYRDLAISWRLSLEQPEIDVREDLDKMIRELSDQLAQLEEHYVA